MCHHGDPLEALNGAHLDVRNSNEALYSSAGMQSVLPANHGTLPEVVSEWWSPQRVVDVETELDQEVLSHLCQAFSSRPSCPFHGRRLHDEHGNGRGVAP